MANFDKVIPNSDTGAFALFSTGGVGWLCDIRLGGVVVAGSFRWLLFIAVGRCTVCDSVIEERSSSACMFDGGKEDEINIAVAVAGADCYRSVK